MLANLTRQPSAADAGLLYCDRLLGKLEILLPVAAFQHGNDYFRLAAECIPNLVSKILRDAGSIEVALIFFYA
ncbi:hypothetical protein [Nostoc sp. JL33]|uniref:hypothetical protein n=1 Tax=Nostoc sp. JL33 TaxID=2815396 RepID=UPI0025EB0A51|nr:hypothetical protein [Nostoc sp. JL33]MBN3873164.1 hypothetical protein [Nostoc sp. JL33]